MTETVDTNIGKIHLRPYLTSEINPQNFCNHLFSLSSQKYRVIDRVVTSNPIRVNNGTNLIGITTHPIQTSGRL